MEGPAKSDMTSQDQESHVASDHSGSLDPDLDLDTDTEMEEQPAAKKQKASQSKARDAGGPAHKEHTRLREGDEVQVQVAMPRTADKGAQGNTRTAKSTYVIDMIIPMPMYDIFSTETPSPAVVKSNTGYQTLHTLFLLPSRNTNPLGW